MLVLSSRTASSHFASLMSALWRSLIRDEEVVCDAVSTRPCEREKGEKRHCDSLDDSVAKRVASSVPLSSKRLRAVPVGPATQAGLSGCEQSSHPWSQF